MKEDSSSSSSAFVLHLRQCRKAFDEYKALLLSSPPPSSSSSPPPPVWFVMGNQAGDADSIVSALTMSLVKQQEQDVSHVMMMMIPVVSISPEDLQWRRPDIRCLLQDMVGLDLEKDLVYVTEISTEMAQGAPWTLVDHNRFQNEYLESCEAAASVYEIIDHHVDESHHVETTPAERRLVAFGNGQPLVGSTCTLVTEQFRLLVTDKKDDDVVFGFLLWSVIVLDTWNGNPTRTTLRDVQAMEYWSGQLEANWSRRLPHEWESLRPVFYHDATDSSNDKPNGDALLTLLSRAKFDPHFWQVELSTYNAYRMDYKRFQIDKDDKDKDDDKNKNKNDAAIFVFGTCSILMTLDSFRAKDDWTRQTLQFMTDSKIELLIVFSMILHKDQPQREVLFLASSLETKRWMDTMVSHLLTCREATFVQPLLVEEEEEEEEEEEAQTENLHSRRILQGSGLGSRKQVVPLLMEALRSPTPEEGK